MSTVANISGFVIDVEHRELKDTILKQTISKKEVVEEVNLFLIPSGRVTVVYNPFNPESLMAAAILKKNYPKYRYSSIQEVIPRNSEYVVWIGVNKILPTENMPFNSSSVHLHFTDSQPVISKERTLSVFDKVLGRRSLTKGQVIDNLLIEYINGPISEISDYTDLAYVTLVDKIMVHFGIPDEGRFKYRYTSIMSRMWEKGGMSEDEAATFYMNMKNAYASLQSGTKEEFKLKYLESENKDLYLQDHIKAFKLLENRTVYHTVRTINGTADVALTNIDFETHYAARKHFEQVGKKYLNVIHGVNGGFFTGNVKLHHKLKYMGVDRYIDC